MTQLNDILEWQEFGSEYRLYVKHNIEKDDKVSIRIIFEDATHEKVTEINVPSKKVKQFLNMINGKLISKRYEINI